MERLQTRKIFGVFFHLRYSRLPFRQRSPSLRVNVVATIHTRTGTMGAVVVESTNPESAICPRRCAERQTFRNGRAIVTSAALVQIASLGKYQEECGGVNVIFIVALFPDQLVGAF